MGKDYRGRLGRVRQGMWETGRVFDQREVSRQGALRI